MVPGTTPKHTFLLPFAPPQGSEFYIIYAQGEKFKEKVLFEIKTERCQVRDKTLEVKLTKEETLKFDQTPQLKQGIYVILPAWIQVGIKTPAGDILWSEPIQTSVERLLKQNGGF